MSKEKPFSQPLEKHHDSFPVAALGFLNKHGGEGADLVNQASYVKISLATTEPNDILTRLGELAKLKEGWLDGDGRALDPDRLLRLGTAFRLFYPNSLPLPYLYPTAEGGIQAEWSLNSYEISLEVELNSLQAEWHCSRLGSKPSHDEFRVLDLAGAEGWQELADVLSEKLDTA